ncbi:Rne/Rng family ribonuclease [Thalassobaculum sp.]|uniref:ribonuclease E/G n=1 Tax=Thalassobaculum sp. TaxID=2022740 RepID=UPI0032EF604E
MTKRMLIDSTHPEETRVVVVDGNRLEDFDFETATKKQLKGNIYLARITRVEPSLQAAFVEYGGNRHGFLAFSEIHPDYYRIPIEDREALLREERARASEEMEDDNDEPEVSEEPAASDTDESASGAEGDAAETQARPETVGGDPVEDVRRKRKTVNRRYKIQEVVARRQIMLVQVVKEERGNKGAALTTYLSLAGRYCVLMPNTARGGGVSRKITHAGDRKRLKQIVEGLDVPDGMAVIVRTAGSERTKTEIKRDYEYLLRLWDDIRETTLKSSAPCLIYEEANLIKRSIRDLYARDIDEVQVEGEEGYRIAKDFMKALVPSHAKRVQPYRDPHTPLLHRYQVESQLDAIHSPSVELKSGGYIVLNQTEALVAIDVNSGRATSERNIEETALKTNLEAADEVARQLRLRDLAGLIVIDFIDMEESRNQHAVERRMKEAMKSDRARIQIGRISHFGLMELSRQRLRPSLFEASTQVCPHCKGTGHIRSVESAALHALRVIEEEGMRNRSAEIVVYIPASIALYILNHKRARLAEIEQRYGCQVLLEQDESLIPPDHRIERPRPKTAEERAAFQNAVASVPVVVEDEDDIVDETDDSDENEDQPTQGKRSSAPEQASDDERGTRRPRRRRRGGRRRSGEGSDDRPAAETAAPESDSGEADAVSQPAAENEERSGESEEDEATRKRRRRGRRGGRRRARRSDEDASVQAGGETGDTEQAAESAGSTEETVPAEVPVAPVADTVDATPSLDVPETVQPENAAAVPSTDAPEPETVDAAAASAAPIDVVAEEPVKKAKPRSRAKAKPAAKAADKADETAEKPKRAPRRRKKAEPAEDVAAVAEAPVEATPAADPVDHAITGETGQDQTVAQDVEAPAASAPVPANEPIAAASLIEVKTIDAPVEKPKKGWWRR